MTDVHRNIHDYERRLLASKYELRRKLYKAFCKDPDVPSELRDKSRYKLSTLPRNSSFTRVRNRCIFTGRSRSVYAFFRISRIVFRGLANQGSLMGVKKASWQLKPIFMQLIGIWNYCYLEAKFFLLSSLFQDFAPIWFIYQLVMSLSKISVLDQLRLDEINRS